MTKWRAPLLLVALAAAAGFAFAHWYQVPSTGDVQLATEQRLMCPQCTSTRLDVCDRAICQDMKLDIARRLGAGETPNSIVRGYRAAYGPAILSSSQPAGPFAFAPAGLVLVALIVAIVVLRRRQLAIHRSPGAGAQLKA